METIEYSLDNGVAVLTLNRPERKNALNGTMKREIGEVVSDIRRNRDVKVLVITGAGGAFCAGGDLNGMRNAATTPAERREGFAELHGWLKELLDLDRPVIAAVDGPAYGAGFGLALVADFVIASTRARFCMAFLKVGLIPDCGSFYTLPRIVGLQRAKEIVFSAREIKADEAQRLGIVLEVQPVERLQQRAMELAASFTQASGTAFGLAKRGLNASLNSDLQMMLEFEATGQAIAFTTEHHKEAVERFMNKQAPQFRWPE
jgi:2-(1,2-epoxy-1,2-dihydrophenyl)acetyl-CoA isomerase